MLTVNETPQALSIRSHWAPRGWYAVVWSAMGLLLAITLIVAGGCGDRVVLGQSLLALLPQVLFVIERGRWRRSDFTCDHSEGAPLVTLVSRRWRVRRYRLDADEGALQVRSKPLGYLGLRFRAVWVTPEVEIPLTEWLDEAEAQQVLTVVASWLGSGRDVAPMPVI
jgi:hypothetical protein